MYGTYEHTVDAKGRMNFPAKLREEYGDHFYIAKTIDEECLTVYTEEGWEALKDRLKDKPTKIVNKIKRFLFAGACTAEPDKQGRIALPKDLRDFAHIETEVVVIGLEDHAEIWDKASWEAYNGRVSIDDIAALSEEIDF